MTDADSIERAGVSLTPRFSGVRERLEAGLNCFNSFPTDSDVRLCILRSAMIQ